jgi:PmbA protein
MVDSAIQLAKVTGEDPYAGLPDPAEVGSIESDLNLYSADIEGVDAAWKIEQARRAEDAALAFDPRITNSEGATFGSYMGRRIFANSLGFVGSYRTSTCSVVATPVAREGDSMERDYWYSSARSVSRLEDPASVGRRAAERALRRLGARKIPTQQAPIIFEPRTARSLLSNIFEAVSGSAIYRKASFLAGRLGERIASDNVTLVDDATIPTLFGSSPFDDEGVRTRCTVVIDRGVLKSYLLDSYTARKLGMKTTGNAARGLGAVDHGNLFIQAGRLLPERMIASVQRGFYVTELIGFGVNIVTGDYSQGASGIWIESGELTYPVSGVTIAGNLGRMLLDVEQVGDDLEFRSSIASPSLLIREMTISGQ